MKKLLKFAIGLFILTLTIIFISYSITFSINDNRYEMEDKIKRFMTGMNKAKEDTIGISISDSIDIDNLRYVLLNTDSGVQYAELQKGLNKKFKVNSSTYTNENIRYEIVKTDKGSYCIIVGRNPKLKIHSAKVIIDKNEYTIEIPKKEYFMSYSDVSPTSSLIISDCKLFDSENNRITDKVR